MHEMSIALNIVKTVEEELQKAKGTKVEKLELVVGKLSGVVVESLDFALDAAKKESPLAEATIQIDEAPGKMRCLKCGNEFDTDDFYAVCSNCNQYHHEVISGKELLIRSMTIV